MDRMACVNIPAFPLQLLIQRHPDWKTIPAAVVDKDKPQGVIQWVNTRARHRRILPGMRYASGLSLASNLRAGVVSQTDIDGTITDLTEQLRCFTPEVEPSMQEPGVFWLDASGLSLLYPSLEKWAGLIGSALAKAGYQCAVAVGFLRYSTYAAARVNKGVIIFENPEEERAHARSVPIVRLDFHPNLRDTLAKLGITTLGGFADLPAEDIQKRFGADACHLYKMVKGELYAPLEPTPPPEFFVQALALDDPEKDIPRLMAVIEVLLDALLESLDEKNKLIATLSLSLVLDCGEKTAEHLSPANPTADARPILNLIRLRLDKLSLPSGVVDVSIEVGAIKAQPRQLELFKEKAKRDLGAADQAFARLRAAFGNNTVMRARLRDGHLPEGRFEWEPMEHLPTPSPHNVRIRPLVRRIFEKSTPLSSRADFHHRHDNPDRFIPGVPDGPVEELVGPYVVSGGWWLKRVHREYYFARTSTNRWLWIYYDRLRRRFFLQGEVE